MPCWKNDGDIFKEIKKNKRECKNISSKIDDEVCAQSIADKFSSIYGELYNKVDLN